MKNVEQEIVNFSFEKATMDTKQKGEEINDNGKIKQIDDVNFVVSGLHDYNVNIDTDDKIIVCDCEGWKHHQYCKHSIGLYHYIIQGKYDDSKTTQIKMEELKPTKQVNIIQPSEADTKRMDMLVKSQEDEQIILRKSIPVLEINYDMYLPISFGKYVELEGELDTLSTAINVGLPFLIEGEKGIGKTLAVNACCCKSNTPCVAYSCSSGTTMGDILGREHLIGNDSVFELGLLPTAIEVANHFGKGILYLDELSALEPEIQKMLNQVIDARRYITVNGHNYRLKKDVVFNIVGTMNPSGYGGTSPLNEDLRSRFIGDVWKYPSAIHLNNILEWKGVPQKVQKGLLQLAMDTLGMKQKGEIQYVLSTRDLDLFTKAYNAFKSAKCKDKDLTIKAIRTAVLIKYADPEDREAVRVRAEESFGVSVPRE